MNDESNHTGIDVTAQRVTGKINNSSCYQQINQSQRAPRPGCIFANHDAHMHSM